MRCLSESYCIKESSDQNSWYIAGSLILFSVFLFAKDENRQALATNLIYTDVLLASNWQTSKQWERWPMPLFISLAQTLLCNRFWRYTCVVSAEVITLWTILQWKGSPLNYTLDKFRARKSILHDNALAELNDCTGGLSHLWPNAITFRTVITFRSSTTMPPPKVVCFLKLSEMSLVKRKWIRETW